MLVSKIELLIQKGDDKFPLTKAYRNGSRFYSDFIAMIKTFEANLSVKEQKSIYDKISAAYLNEDYQVYLQCNCELIVLYYVLRKYHSSFKYEPTYNGRFNPECSFEHNGVVVNIEVKTPNYKKRIEQERNNTLKIYSAERIPDHEEVIEELSNMVNLSDTAYDGIEELSRLDNKLKDFLEHSQKKFPSGDAYYNILVIAVEIVSDVDEWYSYILGDNGVFTNSSYVELNYDNVDAILLCTPIAGLNAWEKYPDINVWQLEETINLIINDTRKEGGKKEKYYNENVVDMFGTFTRGFVSYLISLDENLPSKPTRKNYLLHRIADSSVVSDYAELRNKR